MSRTPTQKTRTTPQRLRPPRPGTKTERLALERLKRNLRVMDADGTFDWYVGELVPDAWRTLEEDIDTDEPKEKVTLYLDQSVAKFYRAMGTGYHARINRVLATYAQLKIARVRQREAELRAERPEFFAGDGGIVKTEPGE
jgi:hypothetical protein